MLMRSEHTVYILFWNAEVLRSSPIWFLNVFLMNGISNAIKMICQRLVAFIESFDSLQSFMIQNDF